MKKLLAKLGKYLYLKFSDRNLKSLTRELLHGVQPEFKAFLDLDRELQKNYIDEAKMILKTEVFEYVYKNQYAAQRDKTALEVGSLQEMDFCRATMSGLDLFKESVQFVANQELVDDEVDENNKFKPL